MLAKNWVLASILFPICAIAGGQDLQWTTITGLSFTGDGAVIVRPVEDQEPFTVAGERGVLVGQQSGELEAWVLPVKLLSHMTIEARVEGYPVPLKLNDMAREIEVRPDHTAITYSHIALVVRQIMFSPDKAPEGTGPVVLFSIDALHPTELVFRFQGDLRAMWPQLSSGNPSPEWVKTSDGSGYYVLHSDFDSFSGAFTIPGSQPGILAPYQERPQTHPLELILHVDPVRDRGKLFPLLMAIGQDKEHASSAALGGKLAELDAQLPSLYASHAAQYQARENERMDLDSPDPTLNSEFGWAETSIEQLRARTPDGGTAFVAGYYASGDSARPGFGWFFGRDALYTLFALDSYGDFADVRSELAYLALHQRGDGKIMHERSQTAQNTNWAALPYQYAAADATPLFLLAMEDYVRASGDTAFLHEQSETVRKAWEFETTHDANGDGIYDNAQGTGWVESWKGVFPQQEIYLALLDAQASTAMAGLAHELGETDVAKGAQERAGKIRGTIEKEYFRAGDGRYAFSDNRQGDDRTDTIFPAVAWWTDGKGLEHKEAALRGWASHRFDTDWGTRSVAEDDARFDPMSYHEGSVWPLFTGWAAIAEYRGGHPLAGYALTMQNADLTFAQDPGAVTELLSGEFYEPFGRSTSHQLWSSAMVITPIVRGMFGLEVNGLTHTLRVAPQLPASWDRAELRRVHVGASTVDLLFERTSAEWIVRMEQRSGPAVKLDGAGDGQTMRVPTSVVEVELPHGLPLRGARTRGLKVLSETREPRMLKLELEAPAGSAFDLPVHEHSSAAVRVEGAEMPTQKVLHVVFEASGDQYSTRMVTLRW
ncbi:MAG TPA: hypothetical protein VGU25_07035 [Acidobacteriaceae bacterium]|nr:hypothetical protein [Acidobacteriaceae bacterium]